MLAATTVTNTGPTSIAGELGLSAGTDVTGAPVVVGAQHIDDDVARAAQVCLDVCGDLLTDNDNDNCGACGNVCGENGTCGGGVCRLCP